MKLFTTLAAFTLLFSFNALAQDCLDRLEEKLCLGNAPYKKREDFSNHIEFEIANQNRKCGKTPRSMIQKFKEAVNFIPNELHPFFCSIQKVFLETDTNSTAYAGSYFERAWSDEHDKEGYRQGGYKIGLNLNRLFQDSSHTQTSVLLGHWMTKKEQTLFARDYNQDLPIDFPEFKLSYQSIPDDLQLLVDVLTHEIAHLIDFSNNVNRLISVDCDNNLENCKHELASAYGLISFKPDLSWRESASYYDKMPCYYQTTMGMSQNKNCKTFNLEEAHSYYRAFANNEHFVSTYAAVSPVEDFAELVTFELLEKTYGTDEYSISFDNIDSFNLTNKYSSGLHAKRQFLERILRNLKTTPDDYVFVMDLENSKKKQKSSFLRSIMKTHHCHF